MNRLLLAGIATAALALSACDSGEGGDNVSAAEGGSAAAEGGSNKTVAAGIDQNGRFFQAAKSVGLDATLGGADPYTVLVPKDEAFGKLPQGTTERWADPSARGELTRILTYHILPGTMLAEDIGKAIDNSNGTAVLATMGGGTLTARKEGDRIVLTDSSGAKVTVTHADQRFSNGVVHHIDGVLTPGNNEAGEEPAAAGQ